MKTLIVLSLMFLCACSSSESGQQQVQSKEAAQAPDVYRVKFDTSKGPFVVEVHRSWAPNGADRFNDLVKQKFFDDARFFRVVKGFIVQFGISGDPAAAEMWRQMRIPDDPVKESNARGTLCFAMAGPGSRTTQLFINLGDNTQSLDPQGFAVFGRVVEGMDVVDQINAEYGEAPDQGRIQAEGNTYLKSSFPNLDYVKTARVE
jgi:peptidyl-prolyl cis-trans isomerase A (cyclophilin A)